MFYHLCRTQGRTLVYILCHMCIHFDQIPRFSHTFQMDDRVVCKLNHLEKTNKNIFFFGQRGSYNCLFFSLTSQQPIKGSKFFVPMEIVENVHPMTHLKFLISSAQSPYNIQSIQYYSSITKLNLWSRSNYFFLFCLCPIFRQKNWYITHHNNLLHSRCLDSSAFGFVPQYSSWWKPYTGRKSVA